MYTLHNPPFQTHRQPTVARVLRRLLACSLLAIGLSTAAAAATLELTVDGLVCTFCAEGIDKAFRKHEATEDVYVNLDAGLVAVALKPGQTIEAADVEELLTDAGYTLRASTTSERAIAEIRQAHADD